MQAVLPPSIVKSFFEFFHSIVRTNSSEAVPMIRTETCSSYFMIIVACPNANICDFVIPPIEKLKLDGDIVSTSHNFTLFQVIAFLIRIDGKSEKILESEVRKGYDRWNLIVKPTNPPSPIQEPNLMEEYEIEL